MKIERVWAMPNKWTFTIKPIKELLQQEVGLGIWVDPFCGLHPIDRMISNDLDPDVPASRHLDAIDFLKDFDSNSVDGVVFDPPYSPRQVSECYKKLGKTVNMQTTQMSYWSNLKNEIARILKVNGKAICFGWSTMGLGKGRGFEMTRILIVPHGGNKNDTLCTVEVKSSKDSL